jgi:hypothetical protein
MVMETRMGSAVFTDANGFEVFDGLAGGDTPENVDFFEKAIGRQQHTHGLADRFGGGIAEDTFCAGIPTGDGAVEGFADDGVVGRFDDGGEAEIGAVSAFVGEGKIAAGRIELFNGNAEGLGGPADQDGKHGDVGGSKQGKTKAGAIKAVMLAEQAEPTNRDGRKNRGRDNATGHAPRDFRTVKNSDDTAVRASRDCCQGQKEKEKAVWTAMGFWRRVR